MRWFKTYGEIYHDSDIIAMPLEQEAVYFRLLAYSSLETPRGSFSIDNLDRLARHVANGQRDVLEAMLDYLANEWETVVPGDDGRMHFRTWAKHQSKPSDAPAATSERKRKERVTRKQTNDVTPLSRPVTRDTSNVTPLEKRRVEIELVDKQQEIDAAAAVVSIPSRADAREAPATDETTEPRSTSSRTVCDTLRIAPSDPAAEVVSAAIRHRGDLDHRYEAVKCREHYPDWGRKTPGAKARLYAKWVDRAFDPAQQQQQQNGHQRTRAPTGITETPISHLPPERLAWAEQFNEDAKRK